MSNMNNRIEHINELARDNPKAIIARAELRYRNIINNIAEKVLDDAGRELIMLAGPSSSGKTTTASKISETFTSLGMKTYVISLDDFYLDREKIPGYAEGNPDFETVYALDLACLSETMKSLMEGKTTKIPKFDFLTGRRSERFSEITLGKNDAVIVEGLHALNPVVTSDLNNLKMLKIYISVSSRIYDNRGRIILNKRNLRFTRRMIRDYQFRGSSVENTYNLWKSVCDGEEKYLFPYEDMADVRINSIHLCEPCLFRDTALKLLEEAQLPEQYRQDAKRLADSLKMFESIPTELVPSDSLLREFLGPKI